MMQNGKFTAAMEDVANIRATTTAPLITKVIYEALENSERFYLPGAMSLVEGKLLDEDLKSTFKLPFDCISLLSECDLEGTASYKISIAIDLEGKKNSLTFKWFMPTGERGWALMYVVLDPFHKKWIPFPGAGFCSFPKDEDGMKFNIFDTKETRDLLTRIGTEQVAKEFLSDIAAIQNLCVLLSLHNVSTVQKNAPKEINVKRVKKGKLPLLDYHVLEVNGDLWDRSPENGKTGGFRSHLRRGHVRRIDKNRRVWVSQCLVRGSREGFVDKEYQIKHQVES